MTFNIIPTDYTDFDTWKFILSQIQGICVWAQNGIYIGTMYIFQYKNKTEANVCVQYNIAFAF